MTLDPDIAPILAMVNSMPPTNYLTDAPDDIRRGLLAVVAANAPRPPLELRSISDSTIPGPDGPIPVRIYRDSTQPAPVVIYFHGGAWIAGDLDTHDYLVRKLAKETQFVFVAVDYRLAPENPFPAGLTDSIAAATWIAEHAAEFGGLDDRIAVAGDSAGGNLAAVVAQTLRDRGKPLAAQLLLYPATDLGGDYPSRHENAEGYWLTTRELTDITKVYLKGDLDLLTTPEVAPLRATDLSNLAPAVIGVAHYDPLRDEGLAYGQALRAAGVDVFAKDYDGMIHTFAAMYHFSDAAGRALQELLTEFSARVNRPYNS
jgi:acetyl esterase